jgi:hypothetical protein
MSRPAATATALTEAQARVHEIEAQERALDPRGRKARRELAEANLLAAEEAHVEEQQSTKHDLYAAHRAYDAAKAATVETVTAFVQAREQLGEAEADLVRLNARARKLGIPVPEFVWLSRDVMNDTELRQLADRGRRAIRDGLFGTR